MAAPGDPKHTKEAESVERPVVCGKQNDRGRTGEESAPQHGVSIRVWVVCKGIATRSQPHQVDHLHERWAAQARISLNRTPKAPPHDIWVERGRETPLKDDAPGDAGGAHQRHALMGHADRLVACDGRGVGRFDLTI